jgi:serine/threonine-protein kinase
MSADPLSTRSFDLPKYEVFEEIGHGGMATVYRGRDRRLGRDVALKVIHPHLRDSADVARRFADEAKAVAKLRHRNIVEVFDVSGEDEREQYLVVELIRGMTLRKLLEDSGPMPPEVAGAFLLEILAALGHAHASGVVHRDVKPENVLVEHRRASALASEARDTPTSSVERPQRSERPERSERPAEPGTRTVVKLTDFGIAKLLDAQGVTSTGQVLGSPAHMAPEQIEGAEVDERADIFASGVLLYECIVGALPFRGNNPAQVLRRVLEGLYPSAETERPTVGKRWSALIDRALAHEPADRFASAGELASAVEAELARAGFESPRVELEAWLDDPAAYAEQHAARMVKQLRVLAQAAGAQKNVLAAAADYNRALAYAPNDPDLLRAMTRLMRAERRRRLLLRAVPVALVLSAGVVSFFVARRVHHAQVAARHEDPPAAVSEQVQPLPMNEVDAGPQSVAVVPTSTTKPAAPRPVRRDVIVDSLTPAFGVIFSLDGALPRPAHEGNVFTLTDDHAHELRFTCQQNLCEPRRVDVQPGQADVHLGDFRLRIRDAILVVDGNPVNHYIINEFPQTACRSGTPVTLPMQRRDEGVHVRELETNKVQLAPITAGQLAHVAFTGP